VANNDIGDSDFGDFFQPEKGKEMMTKQILHHFEECEKR